MQQENNKQRAMNIRGIDDKLYNDFKSAVYASGFKNVKKAAKKAKPKVNEEYSDWRKDVLY